MSGLIGERRNGRRVLMPHQDVTPVLLVNDPPSKKQRANVSLSVWPHTHARQVRFKRFYRRIYVQELTFHFASSMFALEYRSDLVVCEQTQMRRLFVARP